MRRVRYGCGAGGGDDPGKDHVGGVRALVDVRGCSADVHGLSKRDDTTLKEAYCCASGCMSSVWKGSATGASNDLWSGRCVDSADVSGIPCFGEMRWRVEGVEGLRQNHDNTGDGGG